MWKNSYEIAERQMCQMNLKVAQKHAEDAVRLAKKSKAHEGVVESQRLLIAIYDCLGNERRAKDMVHDSIKYTEANFGPGSPEFAEQLTYLAEYEVKSKPEKAEQLMRRYVSIMELNEDSELTLEAYATVSEFFMMNERPSISELYQLKGFALAKQVYGPFYDDLPNTISYYIDTLYELGREEEAESISEVRQRCFRIEMSKAENVKCLRNVIATICGGAENFAPQAECEVVGVNCSLRDLRDAVDELGRIALQDASKIEQTDLFLELRQKAAFMSYYFAKQQLGLAILKQAKAHKDKESLLDVAILFKELSEECLGDKRNRNLYVLALVELARMDETFASDAAAAIENLPRSVERFYSKALVLFMQNGASPETRDALRESVIYNDFVLRGLESFEFVRDRDRMRDGLQDDWKKETAAEFISEFGHLWSETPGAIDLLKLVTSEAKCEIEERTRQNKEMEDKFMDVLRACINTPVGLGN